MDAGRVIEVLARAERLRELPIFLLRCRQTDPASHSSFLTEPAAQGQLETVLWPAREPPVERQDEPSVELRDDW